MTHPPYLQNNIIFRIASADAISKFKAAQAHALIQISRREFEFDHEAREVLLLSYDRVSTWVLRIERAFLAQNGDAIGDDFKGRVISDLSELFQSIEDVFQNHTNVFSEQIAAFVKFIHGYSFPILQDLLSQELRDDINKSFERMLEVLTKYLQHLLIALHEYNNNVILRRPAFICSSGFSLGVKNEKLRLSPLLNRARYFDGIFGINNFIIKNYTDKTIEDDVAAALGRLGVTAKVETR